MVLLLLRCFLHIFLSVFFFLFFFLFPSFTAVLRLLLHRQPRSDGDGRGASVVEAAALVPQCPKVTSGS